MTPEIQMNPVAAQGSPTSGLARKSSSARRASVTLQHSREEPKVRDEIIQDEDAVLRAEVCGLCIALKA